MWVVNRWRGLHGMMSEDSLTELPLSTGKKWLDTARFRCQRACSLVHGCPSQGWYSLSKKVGYHVHGWPNFEARGCSGIVSSNLSRLWLNSYPYCVVRRERLWPFNLNMAQTVNVNNRTRTRTWFLNWIFLNYIVLRACLNSFESNLIKTKTTKAFSPLPSIGYVNTRSTTQSVLCEYHTCLVVNFNKLVVKNKGEFIKFPQSNCIRLSPNSD